MPVLAGWLTGEQVPQETIEQTLLSMGEVLGRYGGERAFTTQPGAGLIAFSDMAYAMQRNDEPPVLDWVPARRTMVYRRPLSGMHPMYYVENWPAKGNLLFASEIKALFAVGVPRRLHLGALEALARYGFIPAPWTAFKDIQIVPAGSILRWQRAKTVLNHATDYYFEKPGTAADIIEELYVPLKAAAAEALPTHEQMVALTGGGMASALSTTLVALHTSTPFTIAMLGHNKSIRSKAWKDAEDVARLCERPLLAITGVDQPDFWMATLVGLETPTADTRGLALHQLLHTSATETGARVAISGLGASILLGEIAGKQGKQPGRGLKQPDLLNQYAQLLSGRTQMEPQLWSQEVAKALRKEERWEETLHAKKLVRKAEQFANKDQGLYYLDLHLRLPDAYVSAGQQLATQERMAVRSPFLKADVIDILTRLPTVLADGTTKESLPGLVARRFLPDLADRGPGLPLSVPTTSLLHMQDNALLKQVLSQEAICKTGLFAPAAVEHLLSQKEVSRELLIVFTTQMLCQMFEVGI